MLLKKREGFGNIPTSVKMPGYRFSQASLCNEVDEIPTSFLAKVNPMYFIYCFIYSTVTREKIKLYEKYIKTFSIFYIPSSSKVPKFYHFSVFRRNFLPLQIGLCLSSLFAFDKRISFR